MTTRRDHDVEYWDAGGHRRIHTETHAEQDSSDLACIALHSGPGFGAATLRPGIEAMASHLAMTLVDLPGCGLSSRHPGSAYAIESYVEDLMQVRGALNLSRPLLLGHGWGAILAVEAALAHPSAFGGVMLVNPLRVLNASGQDSEAQLRQVQRVDETLLPRFTTDVLPMLQRALQGLTPWENVDRCSWWRQMWVTQWAGTPSDAWQTCVAECDPGMEAYFAHKGQAMFDPDSRWANYDLADRLVALQLPATVIASDHDANYVALPHMHVQPLRAAQAELHVEIVSDGGHFLMAEAPSVVARHLQREALTRLVGDGVSR